MTKLPSDIKIKVRNIIRLLSCYTVRCFFVKKNICFLIIIVGLFFASHLGGCSYISDEDLKSSEDGIVLTDEFISSDNVLVSPDNSRIAVLDIKTGIIDFYSIDDTEVSFISSKKISNPNTVDYPQFDFSEAARFNMIGDRASVEYFSVDASPVFEIEVELGDKYLPPEIVIPDSFEISLSSDSETVYILNSGEVMFSKTADEIYEGDNGDHEVLIDSAMFFTEKILIVNITEDLEANGGSVIPNHRWAKSYYINIETGEILFRIMDSYDSFIKFSGARRFYPVGPMFGGDDGVSAFVYGEGDKLNVQRFDGEDPVYQTEFRISEDESVLVSFIAEGGFVNIYKIEDNLSLIDSVDLGVDKEGYTNFGLKHDYRLFDAEDGKIEVEFQGEVQII